MNLYTSYFGNAKTLKANGIYILPIVAHLPKWWNGENYSKLAPKYSMLHLDESEYTKQYKELVRLLNPEKIYREICSYSEFDIALICYEKPGDFCHRHLVAEWLNSNLHLDISEFATKPLELPLLLF